MAINVVGGEVYGSKDAFIKFIETHIGQAGQREYGLKGDHSFGDEVDHVCFSKVPSTIDDNAQYWCADFLDEDDNILWGVTANDSTEPYWTPGILDEEDALRWGIPSDGLRPGIERHKEDGLSNGTSSGDELATLLSKLTKAEREGSLIPLE